MSELNEVIAGRNSVREAILSGKRTINKILISQHAHGTAVTEIITLAKERGIPVHQVPPERFDRTVENSQGILAEISPREYLSLDELLSKVKGEEKPLLVILDGIEDPHNAGAIIRNALALGANGIVMGKWRATGVTDAVTKTSAGASEHMEIARVSNIPDAVLRIKDAGFWVAGLEKGGEPLTRFDASFPLALVIGSEGHGMQRLVRERCDFVLEIPQTNTISSLNASCASAIALYEIFKRKSKASSSPK